jgi:hypothetical protein
MNFNLFKLNNRTKGGRRQAKSPNKVYTKQYTDGNNRLAIAVGKFTKLPKENEQNLLLNMVETHPKKMGQAILRLYETAGQHIIQEPIFRIILPEPAARYRQT